MFTDENQIEENTNPDLIASCICGKVCCECNDGLAVTESTKKTMSKGDNYKIELDKSLYVKQREYFLKTCEVPTFTDAKMTLGNLATFVYDNCEPGLKPYIPSEPQMPYGDLWVSPSDLLIPHVGLKAPLTRKHVQALTHEGILDIGYKIELQFIKELEEKKQEALENQKEELTIEFQESIYHIIKDAEAKERANCQRELTRITEEFEQKLNEEITAMQADLETEFSTFSETHDARIISTWENKLHEAVEETTKNITKKFLDELAKQEQILSMHFKAQMAKLEMRRIYEKEKMKHEHKKELQHAKHRLECSNLAHMMYILCMERRKCCEEKMALEDYYKKKVEGLSNKIVDHKTNIKKLTKKVQKQVKEVQLRETCVLEILKQYQKFISFALRAAPTQAEFLLCIDKLMVFELTDSQSKLKRISSEDLRLRGVLPWPQMTPSYETIEEDPRITEDHHPFMTTSMLKEKEDMVLPVFGFQNNLYIREDFQNVPHEFKSTPREDLWSEDVEFVLKTLRLSISSEKGIDTDPSGSGVPSEVLKKGSKGADRSSTIQFKVKDTSDEKLIQVPSVDDVSRVISVEECESLKDRIDTKSSLKYTTPIINPIDHSQVGKVETNPLLLGTQSSLEVFAKKYNIQLKQSDYFATIPETKEEEEAENPEAIEQFHRFSEKSRDTSVYIKSVESFRPTKGSLTPQRTSNEAKDKIALPTTISGKIPVETRDSFILRQTYLAKVQPRFSVSPNDSIEIKKDSPRQTLTKKKSSKLSLARDSVEMLRESRTLLNQPTTCAACRKKEAKEKEIVGRKCDNCCKSKDSIEVLSGGVIPKIIKMDDKENVASKIKVSHIEMIPVEDKVTHEVPFKSKPHMVGDDSYEKLSALYKAQGKRKSKVNKKRKFEDKCKKLKLSPKARIAGDLKGIEHLQTVEEFTADRMKSFITILSNHPHLIKMFTACQR